MINKKNALFSVIMTGMVGLAGLSHADDTEKMKAEMGGGDNPYTCKGGNACKSKGDCGGPGYSCAGNNACKGKGFVMTKSKRECDALIAKISGGNEKKSGKKSKSKKSV